MSVTFAQNTQLAGAGMWLGGVLANNPMFQTAGLAFAVAGTTLRVAQDRNLLDATALGFTAYGLYAGNGNFIAAGMVLATLSAFQPANDNRPRAMDRLLA
ncbi:MAG: hypothetical protein H6922_06230 [Pseudomonadaceae bacterium]|nr:hypothetical protein [Pseudomonadaceae bacterium]